VKQLSIRPTAIAAMDREAFRIAEHSGETSGLRFYAACDATFIRLATYPDIGKVWPFAHLRLQDIRAWQVKEFNDYLVFYRSLPSRVEILNVIHGSRDIETIFIEQFEL